MTDLKKSDGPQVFTICLEISINTIKTSRTISPSDRDLSSGKTVDST